MKDKRLLMLIGSVCLALMLVVPLVASCAGPAPEEGAEAELEAKLAAEKAKVASLEDEVADLEDEIAELRAPAEVYTMRMQHSWGAAENHFFEQYCDVVRELTGGRIDITQFSDGEIVSWDELSDAVAAGVLDMGHTHPDYYEGVVPEGFLESAPYLWRTLDEEMAVIFRYGIGDIYAEALEETFGYHVLGFQADDCGALMFTREINSLADMEGAVINVLDPTASILAELAGSSATYMGPEEIYTSLALGVLDGVEYGGAKAMGDMGFHEVAKYFLVPRHQIAYFPFYFINMDLWNELPDDLQAILREGVNANGIYMRAFYAEGEIKSLAMMKEAGVTVCTLPDEDVEAIFEKAVEWLTGDYAAMSPRCERAANICLEALKDFGRID